MSDKYKETRRMAQRNEAKEMWRWSVH